MGGLTILYKIFPVFNLNDGIFYTILPIAKNNIMDLNNVMEVTIFKEKP